MEPVLKNQDIILKELIIQPFPIHFDCNDFHIIAFIKDHPEYEAVEAMIKENEDGSAFIRAILTRHDKLQTDYINDRAAVERLANIKRDRKVIYSGIQYLRNEKGGKAHVIIKFTSLKNEEIELDLTCTGKADSKHSHLIDPMGHSANTSLPVMYPEKTTLASARSSVTIDGKKYKLPVKIHIPLIFKGMQGYYSELFKIGVLRTGTAHMEIIDAPGSLKAGEKWIYHQGNEEIRYEIISVDDKSFTVEGKSFTVEGESFPNTTRIEAVVVHNIPAIKSISVITQQQTKDTTTTEPAASVFKIGFSPSLPLVPEQESRVFFSISIDTHNELITGTASSSVENNTLVYLLEPVSPGWASSRPVSVKVKKEEDGYSLKTEILS